MDIKYFGGKCFLLRGKYASLLTAPAKVKEPANVVLSNKLQPFENYALPEKPEEPFIVPGAGEYEVKGIKIQGHLFEGTLLYFLEIDRIKIGLLERLEEPLSDELESVFDAADILLVNLQGGGKMTIKELSELVTSLEPKIIVPTTEDKALLDEFIKDLGKEPHTEKTLKITRDKLLEEGMELVLLSE